MYGKRRPLSYHLVPTRNNFGLLRLVAAASVLFSHAFAISSGIGESEPLGASTGFTLGQHAVNVFFVVSGLLVTASLDRTPSLGRFVTARALRILPGLLVCLAVCALVIGPVATSLPLAGYFANMEPLSWLLRAALFLGPDRPLPGLFDQVPLVGEVDVPLWTLKYEVACYVGLAAVSACGLTRRPAALLAAIAAVVALYAVWLVQRPEVGVAGVSHLLRFGSCFGLGVAAYVLRDRLSPGAGGMLFVLVLLVLASGNALQPLAYCLAEAYGILLLATLPFGLMSRVAQEVDLSYGIYIYGWPLEQLVVQSQPGIAPLPLALTALVVAGLCAFLSWTLVERPALSLMKRRRKPCAA